LDAPTRLSSRRERPLALLLPQSRDAGLEKYSVLVNRLVRLVPAHVASAIVRPSLIDAAHVILVEKLAGLETLLDTLLALLGDLDDMAFLELGYADIQMFRESPDVITADANVTRHPTTQGRAFQAV
jgi:hypothetical protein